MQTGVKRVLDPETGRSISFKKCPGLGCQRKTVIKLADADAGTLRATKEMRDDEQHWFNAVSEQILYLHARAGVTLFDELLHVCSVNTWPIGFPGRVLPLSVDPPRDLALLLDEEYAQITALLQPGRRVGHDARPRLRTLLGAGLSREPGG